MAGKETEAMKVLWICNIMLPVIAQHLKKPASNKEGWLTGLLEEILKPEKSQEENRIKLGVAFPGDESLTGYREEFGRMICYGFAENTAAAHEYDPQLEEQMRKILEDFKPDVVHCFGTEYGHTLAAVRACRDPQKVLIGIQGLCSVYADAYMADLPKKVIRNVTLRDFLKRDSLPKQREKYVQRGEKEIEAIKETGNVTGRTGWDRYYTHKWNPDAEYFLLNETLRPEFYTGKWEPGKCEPHRIFLSQGDYPIKGLHYMLLALPDILKVYPDTRICVAGNSIIHSRFRILGTMKILETLGTSSYGNYIRKLIRQYHLEEKVEFAGRLDAAGMKKEYLRSGLFVCCSSIENSPNSLGEAMLLGMPCVSADVGGIQDIFTADRDGIVYRGYRSGKDEYYNKRDEMEYPEGNLKDTVNALKDAVLQMFSDPDKAIWYGENAREHAKITHDRGMNSGRLMEIYAEIATKPLRNGD